MSKQINVCGQCGGLFMPDGGMFAGRPCKCDTPTAVVTSFDRELMAQRDRAYAERDALKAKLATVERHMDHCRSVAGVPDDETLAVWIAEMKAKCEALEVAIDALRNDNRRLEQWQERAEALENQLGPTGKIQWEAQGGRLEFLEAAIRRHRDQRGDDRCWLDDEELYRALPEGFTPPQRDTAVELDLCKKFIQCRHNPATEYVSPQRRIEALEVALSKIIDLTGDSSAGFGVRCWEIANAALAGKEKS